MFMLILLLYSGWEGFGEDPYLQGVAGVETIKGIQDQNVVRTRHWWIIMYQNYNKRLPFLNPDRCCQALCPQQSRNESKECKYHHSLLTFISAIYFTHLLPCTLFSQAPMLTIEHFMRFTSGLTLEWSKLVLVVWCVAIIRLMVRFTTC